jgi:hypothetical protein
MVAEDLEARKQLGLKRYGSLLQPNNGRDNLQDAYEEVLDLCVYLKTEIEERRLRGTSHQEGRGDLPDQEDHEG